MAMGLFKRRDTTADTLEKLAGFHEALLSGLELKPMLRNLLTAATQSLGAERAAIFLYHAEEGDLRGEVGTGVGTNHTVSAISLSLAHEGPIQRAFFGPPEGLELPEEILLPVHSSSAPAEGKPFCWNKPESHCNLQPRIRSTQRAQRCPTCPHFGGVGVLSLEGMALDAETRQLLPVLARLVALALRNAQLYETALNHQNRLARNARVLEVVNTISRHLVRNLEQRQVLEALAWGLYRDLGYYRVTITLNRNGVLEGLLTVKEGQIFWTEGRSQLRFPIQDSSDPFARAARERRPLVVSEKELPPTARAQQMAFVPITAYLPILAEEEVLGVVAVDHGDSGQAVDSEELRYVQLLSYVAGAALKNAHTFEERDQASRALALERQKLTQALELMGDAVIVLEEYEGFANRKAREVLGLGERVALDNLPPELYPALEGQPVEYLQAGRTFSALGTREGRLWVLVLHEITAIRQAQQHLENQSRFLGHLAKVTRQALESPDSAHLLSTLANHLADLFAADQVYLTLWDPTHNKPLPVASHGFPSERYREVESESPRSTFTEAALRSGKVLVIEDTRQTPFADVSITRQFPSASAMVLPFIAQSRWLGAAILGYQQHRSFSDLEVAQAQQAAELIALALLKTRLLEELERRERRFKALLESSQDVVYVVSPEGFLRYVSPNAQAVLGYDPEGYLHAEVNGLSFFHPEDRPRAQTLFKELLVAPGTTRVAELRLLDAQQQVRQVELWGRNLTHDPAVGGVAITLRDISQRHQAELARQESERRYRGIFDHTEDAIFLIEVEPDGTFRFEGNNPAHQRQTGIAQEAIAGKTPHELLPPELAEQVSANYRRALSEGRAISYEETLELPAGRRTWLTQLVPIPNSEGRIDLIAGISRDISERKLAEAALRESEARNRAILQALPDLLFVMDAEGTILAYQGRRDQLLMEPEAFLGRRISEVLPPEVAERINSAITEVLTHGEMRSVEYRLNVQGEPLDFEARLAQSAERQVLAVVRDITQQKQLERMKQEFVSAVSHELRTPLVGILGFAELLEEEPDLNEESREFARLIRESGLRLKNMVDNLLDSNRLESGRFEVNRRRVNLTPVLRDVAAAFRGVAQLSGIALELHLAPLPSLPADPDRIGQVIGNLLSNAFKFTPKNGRVTLRAYTREDRLRIEVEDTGPGISPDEVGRLFQRYARTRTALERGVRGTGLGLYISKAIVEAHHGTIGVNSELGKGSCFYVELPISAVEAGEPALGHSS
jgi:PAS domain S-box-containing protein